MQGKISRRKIAQYAADKIERDGLKSQLIDEIAAYLIESKRLREADLVVRAIEDELAYRGTVIARVTSARPIDASLRKKIEATIQGADRVLVEEIVDPTVVGGVRIETPGKLLDATLKRKILALRQAKV